jgi:hypothetical protein
VHVGGFDHTEPAAGHDEGNSMATNTTSVASRTAALVALDIDGTLLDRDQQIPPETNQAIDLVRACGQSGSPDPVPGRGPLRVK